MPTPSRALRLAMVLAGCAFPLSSQGRTWTVDASNRPGTDFTVLQTAFDNVAEGDTLVVRGGTYQPSATTKALTLFGDGGVVIASNTLQVPSLDIGSIPRDRAFVLKRVILRHAGGATGLRLAASQGRIHLEALDIQCTAPAPLSPNRAIEATSCASVTVQSCRMGSVATTDSGIVIADSTMRGTDAERGCTAPVFCVNSSVGLRATNSNVTIASCAVQGGEGNGSGFYMPSADGILLTNSALVVCGTSVVQAGQYTRANEFPKFAVAATSLTGSSLRHSLTATFVSGPNAPPFLGVRVQATAHQAALLVHGTRYGGPIQLTWLSAPQDWFAVVVSGPSLPILIPAGDLLIDPATAMLVWTGVQGPSGSATISFPLPPVGPACVPVAFQGINGAATGGELWLSNAVVAVID